MPVSVSDARLHERPFESAAFEGKKVTLLPFFNRAGEVKLVLVVDAASPTLRVIRTSGTRFSFGIRNVRVREASVRRLGPFAIEALSKLWHFDPRWLLDDPRFTDRRLVTRLRVTNCVDRFPEGTAVSFSSDLRHVKGFACEKSSEKLTLDRLQEARANA